MKYDHGVITDYLQGDTAKMQQHYISGNPIAVLLNLIEQGNAYEVASSIAGIDESTFHSWKRGELPKTAIGSEDPEEIEEAKSQFSQCIKKADAVAESKRVRGVVKAAEEGNWMASAWWLERRRGERYGKKVEVDLLARNQIEAAEATVMEMLETGGDEPNDTHTEEAIEGSLATEDTPML